jgi:hypothetical protein
VDGAGGDTVVGRRASTTDDPWSGGPRNHTEIADLKRGLA